MITFLSSLVSIYSADINRAVDFYGKTLGLEETYRFPYEGKPEHVEFRVGDTTIAVSSPAGLQAHGMPPASPGHPFEIGIKTNDVETAVKMLRAAGVEILKEPSLSAAGNRGCSYTMFWKSVAR